MTEEDAGLDEAGMAWVQATFYAGESDFRERVVKQLLAVEKVERSLIKQARTIAQARSHRDRADAMKGAALIVGAMETKGRDSTP